MTGQHSLSQLVFHLILAMSEPRRRAIDESDSEVETNDFHYLNPPHNPPAPPPSERPVSPGVPFAWRTWLGLGCAATLLVLLLLLQPALSRLVDASSDFIREGRDFTHELSKQFWGIWCDQIGGSRCRELRRENPRVAFGQSLTGFPAVEQLGEQIRALNMLDLGVGVMNE